MGNRKKTVNAKQEGSAEIVEPPKRAPYYRRDQARGITAPNLAKDCTYAEHIAGTRGRRTRFTSISLDQNKIRDIGEATYQLKHQETIDGGHVVIEHAELMAALERLIRDGDREEKQKAISAKRYALKRAEGLVDWRFKIDSVSRQELITWAFNHVQPFFTRL